MEDLVDLIATDASPSDVADSIKGALMAKAAERIDAFRPDVASTVLMVKHQRRKRLSMNQSMKMNKSMKTNNQLKRKNNETYHRRSLTSKIYH